MKNKGISLITLVITIIIMIILAGAIILTLTQSNIFNKANDAVSKYNIKEVQAMMDLTWTENFDNNISLEDMQTKLNNKLEENNLDDKYAVTVTEKGPIVTEIGGSGNNNGGASNVKPEWKDSVVAIVDEVPIPKGFAASPYDGEKTKAGGLVIYELTEAEIAEGKTTITDDHQTALETRNQFVWVPVDKENFATKFVRDGFGRDDDYMSDTITSDEKYWELELKDDNTPSDTQNSSYVSDTTLAEAKAMYASVKEYGGFYIARYEVGYSYDDENNKVPSITMGKYPYNYVIWAYDMIEEDDDGWAVDLARKFYPNNSDNTTGVVSTLTYGVQWDTTLNWWTGKDLTDSTEYGNYYNTAISSDEYNANAKYSANYGDSWYDEVTDKGDGDKWLLTTGAFKNANVNNIYDMAGNLYEWTMEGSSSYFRVHRGGFLGYDGDDEPVIDRGSSSTDSEYNDWIGFRPTLYIK